MGTNTGANTNASKSASTVNSTSSGSPSGSQESPRKHRLTDLNVQIKHLNATPGKMLVQRGGKQILVPSKNIIKLSPNAGATSSLTNTAAEQTASPTSGLHAIQLPGKGGVQYVRVLTNNKSASGTSATVAMPKTMQAHKITAVRSPAATSTPATSTSTSAAAAPATAVPKANTSMGSTNKIVMRTTGGSIVPLPSMQTLVSKVFF